MRQEVGNYPGVTVERKVGRIRNRTGAHSLYDLPGCYSLRSRSPDERIASDFVYGRLGGEAPPDAIVCLVNACQLDRHLYLVLQMADLGRPLVVAVNFLDEAERQGLCIDFALLSERLGAAVVGVSARSGHGIDRLKTAIDDCLRNERAPRPQPWPAAVEEGLGHLESRLPYSERRRARGELLRLLFDPSGPPETAGVIEEARTILRGHGTPSGSAEAIHLHRIAGELAREAVRRRGALSRDRTRAFDRILAHRIAGPGIFALLILFVFQAVYAGAAPLMEGIEEGKSVAQGLVAPLFEGFPLLQSLTVNGVMEGVGAFVVFLPQILILFFFISLLEETGYLARAAFLMDRLFAWCGLSGKSFVPLLSSYACAVPGILATRTIEDSRARLGTILVAPLMSCSARLPVYVLLIGAFVAPVYGPWISGLVLFGMHAVGLAVAVPVAWAINRWILRTPAQTFVLELPPLRLPQWRNVGWRVWESGREFVMKAGTIILAATIVVWGLLSFPRQAIEAADGEGEAVFAELVHAPIEESWLGQAGRFVQPVFAPAGFDWRVTVGILASFPAREVIIPTLGVLYRVGDDVNEESPGLRQALREQRWDSGPRAGEPVFTLPVALALMVFFALCSQCAPTLAVIAKESGWRWAIFAFAYLTALAWVGATATFQTGTWFLERL